jgi:hypothetical protein
MNHTKITQQAWEQLSNAFPDREVKIEIAIQADDITIHCWAYSGRKDRLAFRGYGDSFKEALVAIIKDEIETRKSEGW